MELIYVIIATEVDAKDGGEEPFTKMHCIPKNL